MVGCRTRGVEEGNKWLSLFVGDWEYMGGAKCEEKAVLKVSSEEREEAAIVSQQLQSLKSCFLIRNPYHPVKCITFLKKKVGVLISNILRTRESQILILTESWVK